MMELQKTQSQTDQVRSKDEVLVRVDGVSKKFCKSLKKSLWYGVQDITSEVLGKKKNTQLRNDEFWAVDDVSFELKRGECLGLIGHNGAGKSTLLKMLNGLIKPDKGRIEMHGRVGALIELGTGFNPILTGRENVYNNAAVLGFSRREVDAKFDAIIDFAEIGDFIDSPVQNYSSGMKVRLGFAVASQLDPDILLIDEVLAVGDTRFRIKCYNVIERLVKKSCVIFVSHSMPQIARVCNRIMMLHQAKLEYLGDDIGEGVNKYLELAENDEIETAISHVDGVEINNFTIENDHYETDIIDFSSTVSFRFQLTNSTDLSLGVNVAIYDQELKPVALLSSKNAKMIFTDKLNKITIQFSNQLAPGKYFIHLMIFEEKSGENLAYGTGKIVGSYKNVSSFKVVNGNFYSQIPIQLNANWEFLK